ncbi:MAG: VOC family protein [Burkholderiales bacterium]|nr:VOC family protein [Burkholderiales bacterium]
MKEYAEVFKTPGAFSWTELMTPDPKAASEFYASLFGWTFDTMDMGDGPYRVVKVGETAVGGMMKTPPTAQGMPPAWACYVTVASADATAERCKSLGGKVLLGPVDIPKVGRFVVLQDPQGAVFNAIAYAPM